jgi:predicted N-acetyltransferase YhbS
MGTDQNEVEYYCRGARIEDIPEIVEVTQSAFGVQRTGDFAKSMKNRLETYEDDRLIIEKTSKGEKIIGSVPIFRYPLHFGPGITMQSGGLFMVAVRKEYQRRGLGQKAIADCNEYLKKQGCEINLLFTGSPDFYRHQGYEQGGGKPLFVLDKLDLKNYLKQDQIPDSSILTRPMKESDLPEIAQIYEHFNEKFPLTRIRSLEYWQHNFKLNPPRFSNNITVFSIDGKIQAYVWGHASDQAYEVTEYGIDSANSQFSEELLTKVIFQFFLNQLDKSELTKVNLHLFQIFPLVKMAITAGARDCTAYWSALMFAILNLPKFLMKWSKFHQKYQLQLILENKLKDLPEIHFAIQIEDQILGYQKIGNKIQMELNPSVKPQRIIPISRKNFSILTMGNFTAEELVESEYWNCDLDLIPYLNHIFPHLEGMVYPLDGF